MKQTRKHGTLLFLFPSVICVADYQGLYEWSVSEPEAFWSEVWDRTGIVSSVQATRVLDTSRRMDSIPEWFEGARLNVAENMLWCRSADKTAIIATGN